MHGTILAPAPVTDGGASHNNADTYGWDTTFATSFTNANAAITANWANVSAKAKDIVLTATDSDSGLTFALNAVFGAWQFTLGGDGKNVRMQCPITSGTYTIGSKAHDLSTTSTSVIIEVGMEWVPNPDQMSFVVNGNTAVTTLKSSLDQNQISELLRKEFTDHSLALSASATALLINKGKEWSLTDGNANYYIFFDVDKDGNEFLHIYQFVAAWANNLKLLAADVNSSDPAVVIITIVNTVGGQVGEAMLPSLCSTWFNLNIGEFNHVFASLDLSPVVSQNDRYKWMKPTATSYAVVDQGRWTRASSAS